MGTSTPLDTSPHAGEADASLSFFEQPLVTLPWRAPLHWLVLGWRDFCRAPGPGLFYGGCFVGMGWLLLYVFQHAAIYTLALSAGFLLLGPVLCLGLYDVSRQLEAGERPGLLPSLTAWRARAGALSLFAGMLLIVEMVWARASLIVFALSFNGMPDFKGSLLALLNPAHLEFIVGYTAVGAVFAALIYSLSVVAMPMILDRHTDAITAALTSLRLCLTQPGVMLLWGALVTGVIALAMAPGFFGLLVAGPVIGHASWHAYRSAVPR